MLFGQRGIVRSKGLVCLREVEGKLVEITASNMGADLTDRDMVAEERRIVMVDREATTAESSK